MEIVVDNIKVQVLRTLDRLVFVFLYSISSSSSFIFFENNPDVRSLKSNVFQPDTANISNKNCYGIFCLCKVKRGDANYINTHMTENFILDSIDILNGHQRALTILITNSHTINTRNSNFVLVFYYLFIFGDLSSK